MKKFFVKYTPLVLILLIICLALLISGFVLGLIKLIDSVKINSVNTALYSLIIVLDVLLIIFAVSVLVNGRYFITESHLIFSLGFIKTKYSVLDIVEVNIFKNTNKLVVYFNNMKYTVILISPKKYEEFIDSLRSANKNIIYSEQEKENEN